MPETILDQYLNNLKFIVLTDRETGLATAIYFDYTLPNMHCEIYGQAVSEYSAKGLRIGMSGGGRITKIGNYIVLHSRSGQYGRYEDVDALRLAPLHPMLCDRGFVFLSQSGEDNALVVVREYEAKM
ncbi:MAG: hypothetical protein A2W93_00945 [Bacteroidetes bacterium GWF2_43_63]|nr:MAG: hypothetical protein A2W94_14990 [Bacteroidetes bacterium GWE2_42_42]OFY54159.1 MAG: hypothetical protein A2W93_00945 [Bacteroidetes bacterium GWF2_43_63]HBG70801.1 hypothetical protein [Bacteroidales bacterium]HCB61705.1 hypothetical protein [Bacteroidales bacterium]HCY22081.1 hypothetical protein [Bacteroidales bacterium]